jgi:hypothetical protein
VSSCKSYRPSQRSWHRVRALVLSSYGAFPCMERAQEVLDEVRRGPVGPPGAP